MHDFLEFLAFAVVRAASVIDTAILIKSLNLIFAAFREDGDGFATVVLRDDHGWNISHSVADVDDVAIRNAVGRGLLVHADIIVGVIGAFGNTEEVLGLLGEVDGEFRPDWLFGDGIKEELASVDLREFLRDRAAINDFLVARADEIVLDLDADGVTGRPCVETIYTAVYDGTLDVKARECLRMRRPRRRSRGPARRTADRAQRSMS